MVTKFGMFVIGKSFSKEFSNHVSDKNVLKWEILPTKNQNNQYEIVYEYEEVEK